MQSRPSHWFVRSVQLVKITVKEFLHSSNDYHFLKRLTTGIIIKMFEPTTFALDDPRTLLFGALATVVILAVIYNDRTAFSPGRREGVYEPPPKLPLLGQTVEMVISGTERQLERQRDYHWGE